MGWWLEEANLAQISLNLLDTDVTPMHTAYEECLKEAGVRPREILLQICC